MPVEITTGGALVVTDTMSGLAGRMFARRSRLGDAADVVVCQGAIDVGGQAGPCVELCIASAQFGAVPAGWTAAIETFDLEGFAEEYRELNAAERSTLALEAVAASKATKSAKRESPWSRS